MRFHSIVACLAVLLMVQGALAAQGPQKWTAQFIRQEFSGATLLRTMVTPGTMYYDGTRTTPETYPERIRYDIPLIASTASLYEIYEDQLLAYSACSGECGWADLYAYSFPELYEPAAGATTSPTSVNGWPAALLNVAVVNGYTIYTLKSTQEVVQYTFSRSNITYVVSIENGTYVSGSTAFDTATILTLPAYCPTVDPGCFRIDLGFVMDYSGSVGSGPLLQAKQFVNDLVSELRVEPAYVHVAYARYNKFANLQVQLSSSKSSFLSSMWAGSNTSTDTTSTANGMAVMMSEMLSSRGRLSARKVFIIVTDGVANQPCQAANLTPDYWNQCACSTKNNASGPACATFNGLCTNGNCEVRAIQEIQFLQTNFLNLPNSTTYAKLRRTELFAIGVGGGIDSAKLVIIANNIPSRVFQVASYAQLNTLIDRLLALLLCEVPGAFTCPNDCLPGGFCCGRGCVCLEDCTTLSTNCQTGYCEVALSGSTQCELTDPQDSLCFDDNVCTADVCTQGVGCTYPPIVVTCNDGNPCTTNDTCNSGACSGTPDPSLPCSDGVVCTVDSCTETGTCFSAPVVCTDPDPSDCNVPFCNPSSGTGLCEDFFVNEGELCGTNSSDPCIVLVCVAGSCVERTVDSSDCLSSSDPVNPAGPIVGGVVGAGVIGAGLALPPLLALACLACCIGVCVALVLALALTVCLVCLGLISAVGFSSTTSLAATAEPMVELIENPMHVASATEGVNKAFEE